MKIIDTNASFGFWPIQRFSHTTLESLDQCYRAESIDEVWISAVESILYPEPDTFDQRLFAQLNAFPRFRPVKTINPLLSGWQKRLSATMEQQAIRAIKVFPSYHGYPLQGSQGEELCQYAASNDLPLLIQIRVNDERNQPVAMQVPSVPAADIAALSARFPDTRIIALCAYRNELPALAKGSERLLVELSCLDGAGILEFAAREMGVARVAFGTHAPFLLANSAHQKLRSCTLPSPAVEAIASGNLAC